MTEQGASGPVHSSRQSALRIIGTLVALVLLVYLLSQQGWEQIWAAVRSIPLWRFGLAFLLMLASRFAISMRWYTLLHSARLDITFWQTLKITFAGLFATNFLPTTIGGDVVRLAGAIRFRLDAAISAASLIADRLVGMTGMAMVLPLSIPALLNLQVDPDASSPLLVSTIFSYQWLEKIRGKISKAFKDLFQSLAFWLKNPAALARSLGYSWVHMVCFFLILQILLGGVGEQIPLWTIAGLYSLVYFVTLIPISINGYGLQEISMTLIFSNLGRASLSSGLTVALLFRTITMLASLPGAFFLPEFLTSHNKPETRDQVNGPVS